MAWESPLDRLVARQIHLAERGEVPAAEAAAAARDMLLLRPSRAESWFHLGHARVLLGVDLETPPESDRAACRWHLFGRVRAHERRGERNWVADLLTDRAAMTELLAEPRIAGACLPLAMRTLFWSGDLDIAVQAIDYLATLADSPEARLLVDAAMSDLLVRLERRDEAELADNTLTILQRCVRLSCFDELPTEIRAGYLVELASRRLAASDFDAAAKRFEQALTLAGEETAVRSRAAVGLALARLRAHDVHDLRPSANRVDRDAACEALDLGGDFVENSFPEAHFLRGLFAYEQNDWEAAVARFEVCRDRFRRVNGRDRDVLTRTHFLLAASLLAGGFSEQSSKALRLMDETLGVIQPDLETFYFVHEQLKARDRKLALRFLDAVDVGRGSTPDQLLFVALEYLSLGEAPPAAAAAERVLEIAVDVDQRIEAMRVMLTANNMRGDKQGARETFDAMRDLLLQRGRFEDLEKLLLDEDFIGQALDHLEARSELVALYEEMEDREVEKAQVQLAIARSLRARKDVQSLRDAHGVLLEVEIAFPELAKDELRNLEKLLELSDAEVADVGGAAGHAKQIEKKLGRKANLLVVGGNERQRRHHPRLAELAGEWGFDGDWLMANYSSPQKLVAEIADRLRSGSVDALLLLHWNRHETTEPALELARRAGVPARTLHYAGFTSLQVGIAEQLERLVSSDATADVERAGPNKGNARKVAGRH